MVEPIVELQNGFVRGVVEKHEEGFIYYSFKGIPYAEPPVGALRFKDPVPKRTWTGVVNCKNDGSTCLQYDFLLKIKSSDEDCLYLNVYAQSIDETNENKPVMVFIHPGACIIGSSQSSLYGPDYLIRKNVVLVIPSYRIGVLGFLDLEDEVAPGNQGLKDLVLVLRWIQQNIRVFGGDPENITVLGHAGSASIAHYLALSPLAKGLIHKVISAGTTVYNPWVAVTNPKSHAIKLCSLMKQHLTESKEILEFLTSVDAEKLVEAQELLRRSLDCFPFGPGVDSKSPNPFMPVHRYDAADQGVHLPYLVGCNSHESLILLSDTSTEDAFKLADLDFGQLFTYNSRETLSRYNLTEMQVRRLYYKNEVVSHENLDNFLEFTNDFHFFESIHRFARVQAERSSAATYLYQYSYDHPNTVSKVLLHGLDERYKLGCSHYEEIPFLFKNRLFEERGLACLKKGTRSYRMMEQLTEMWTNFARYGKPTIDISELLPVHWLPIADGTVLRYLDIDEDITMQTIMNVDQKLLAATNINI